MLYFPPKDSDYDFALSSMLFSFDQRRYLFNISIIDDMNLESNETFSVNITVPDHIQLEVAVTQIAVTINENEGVCMQRL